MYILVDNVKANSLLFSLSLILSLRSKYLMLSFSFYRWGNSFRGSNPARHVQNPVLPAFWSQTSWSSCTRLVVMDIHRDGISPAFPFAHCIIQGCSVQRAGHGLVIMMNSRWYAGKAIEIGRATLSFNANPGLMQYRCTYQTFTGLRIWGRV